MDDKNATEEERRKIAEQALRDVIGEKDEMTVLPAGWNILNLRENGGDYADRGVAVVFNCAVDAQENIIAHAIVRRHDGRRPTWEDMSRVRRAFFREERGKIAENNQLFPAGELSRQLWQVVGSADPTPETIAPVINVPTE